MSPARKASGPNTTTVVAKEDSTPIFTSLAPSTAAFSDFFPFWRCVAMFSASTMPSSMSSPMASSSATIVIMLIE